MNENDVLGFNPQDLFRNDNEGQSNQPTGNGLIYRMRPADSKSEDGIYRATIKVVYNPFDRKNSFLDQQTYAMNDAQGFFSVVSALTLNNEEGKNCPIFKAWKKCRYAEEKSALWLQQAKKEEGGRSLFDKRMARYCVVQILADENQPDLVGSFKLWKIPASIYQIIKQKQDPTDPKKAAIPVMDYLFGRAIDIEVTPGPDDKNAPERKNREISYAGELSEDIVSCINPDGSPLLTSAEQDVLDEYVDAMKKVWKSKDPEERAELLKEVLADANTAEFRKIYSRVLEEIKTWAPNLDTLSYHEWSPEVKTRVENWINIVLAGNDPRTASAAPEVANTVATETVATPATPSMATVETDSEVDDLPF
jgi:hypothetical protein